MTWCKLDMVFRQYIQGIFSLSQKDSEWIDFVFIIHKYVCTQGFQKDGVFNLRLTKGDNYTASNLTAIYCSDNNEVCFETLQL